MSLRHERRRAATPIAIALLSVTVAALLLLGGSVPHLHVDDGPAFFNQEHDLTLLASIGSQGPLPMVSPTPGVDVVTGITVTSLRARPASRVVRLAEPRAPPLA